MKKTPPIIISLGGSLVIPNGGIDISFLTSFHRFIRKKIVLGYRFFIVVGGGATARHYIAAGKKIVGNITDWDLDWLGIHATRLNAHLIRTIFQDVAHPRIIQNYSKKITKWDEPIVIAAGGEPGCSTDYDAVMLARDYHADVLINMSNIPSVFEKDPKKFPDAKPFTTMTWRQLGRLVGTKWKPGKNVPFDPPATQLAREISLSVYIIGKDLENLDRVLEKKDFVGTLIT